MASVERHDVSKDQIYAGIALSTISTLLFGIPAEGEAAAPNKQVSKVIITSVYAVVMILAGVSIASLLDTDAIGAVWIAIVLLGGMVVSFALKIMFLWSKFK